MLLVLSIQVLVDLSATASITEPKSIECMSLLKNCLILPAYDQCLKASHLFNLLDSRGSLSVSVRSTFISRIRSMVNSCCKNWLNYIEKN